MRSGRSGRIPRVRKGEPPLGSETAIPPVRSTLPAARSVGVRICRRVWCVNRDWVRPNGYSERMRVRVLCFGILKDLRQVATEEIEVPEGSTVADLLQILEQGTSNSSMNANVWQGLAVAVNREYSSAGAVLRDGDEVALLPPVSGGWDAG